MSGGVTNIRLAGVGGQGILVASEVLCDALLASGCDVKKSEVHGMAQRVPKSLGDQGPTFDAASGVSAV